MEPVQSLEQASQPVIDKLMGWGNDALGMLPNAVVALLVMVVAWFVARAVGNLVRRGLSRVTHNAQLRSVVGIAARLGVWGIGLFIALSALHLDKAVTSLLAGLGVVGVALGFALQDIAANFMSGVMMAVRRPFRIGDVVDTQGVKGTIEAVDLRATSIRQPTGELVLIPNRKIYSDKIVNISSDGRIRIDLEVGVSYAADLEQVESVTRDVLEGLSSRLEDTDVDVMFTGFGGSSINLVARFWTSMEKPRDGVAARSEAVMAIHSAYDEHDITIPFPIRTLDFGIEGGERLDSVVPKWEREPAEA